MNPSYDLWRTTSRTLRDQIGDMAEPGERLEALLHDRIVELVDALERQEQLAEATHKRQLEAQLKWWGKEGWEK